MSNFFNDSAIIDASIATPDSSSKSTLAPGNALSKLLDSAIANAARESTPEPESKSASTSPGSMFDFVPSSKADRAHIYSIEKLLELRHDPGVSRFDTRKIPGPAFWATKHRSHDSAAKPSHGKKSRRNNNHSHNSHSQADGLNWERKPAGFLKHSEIDGMSSEKISQLLGETPDEDTPDWDNPGASSDMRLSMGSTVADFERWKQEMRREEKRKHGDDLDEEVQTSNEVDSFFSFVKPKEASQAVASPSVKSSDAKSSRFSSFFGSNGPNPQGSNGIQSQGAPGLPAPHKRDSSSSADTSSRFFRNESPSSGPRPFEEQNSKPAPVMRQGPPPGIPPQQFPQNMNGQNMNVQSLGPNGTIRNGPPPGLQQPGMPFFPNPNMGAPPSNNDSFFMSLLSKREGEEAQKPGQDKEAEGKTPNGRNPGQNPPNSVPHNHGPNPGPNPQSQHPSGPNAGQNPQNPGSIPGQAPGPNAGPGPNPGQNPNGVNQNGPVPKGPNGQYFPYGQHMNMQGPPPGMQAPPGMFPPGMFPPGIGPTAGQFPPGSNSGNNSQGKDILPWMRFAPPGGPPGGPPNGPPNGPPGAPPGGQFPPGFAPPQGFDPSFSHPK